MDRKLLFRQILILLLVAALFLGFNGSLYMLLTRRLKNNFSDGAQPKMVDSEKKIVAMATPYLPTSGTASLKASPLSAAPFSAGEKSTAW